MAPAAPSMATVTEAVQPRALHAGSGKPRRVMMTLDAVGGVWRYAMDLGAALRHEGMEVIFIGFGPAASAAMSREAEAVGRLVWLNAPLDWMAAGAGDLDTVPQLLEDLVSTYQPDVLHLNLPSQASGLDVSVPVVVVSHSCVVTWFKAVRQSPVPEHWSWQRSINRAGFNAADAVVAPSRSHADMLVACYGEIPGLTVIANASSAPVALAPGKRDIVFAAGRWWDDGKNAAVLDRAAALASWPVIMAGPTVGPDQQSVEIRHAQSQGELTHAEIRQLMGGAGLFVSPSLYEPFGLAALEAARAQVPLVLADIPTYRELWDGTAVFADPRCPESFAAAINGLISDPDQRRDLGRAAHERSKRFSSDAQAAAYLGLYQRVMARSPELARAV